MKNTIISLLLLATALRSSSQDQKNLVLSELNKLSDRYRNTDMLSFSVVYRYADEREPGVCLDSLYGNCILNQNAYWSEIDKTQTLYNGEYIVNVYQEDSLIYLSKPSGKNFPVHPVAIPDTALAGKDIRYGYEETKRSKILILDFPGELSCKRISYEIDKKSGYLVRLTQVVNSSYLYQPEVAAEKSKEGRYSIVETVFSQYQSGKKQGEMLNIDHYVKKEGQQYVAATSYKFYKVFLASPNL